MKFNLSRRMTVIGVFGLGILMSVGTSIAQSGPAPVVVAEVIQRDVAAEHLFVGTVLPSKRAVVGSAVDGRVLEFPVNDGDPVKAGDALAQLRTKTVELELGAAVATLSLRRHELEELQNGSRPEELAIAKATWQRNNAVYAYAKARLDRTQNLFTRGGSTTQEEFDQAVSTEQAAQQSLLESKAKYDLAIAGPRKEQIEQAEARMLVQQAEVDRLNDRLAKYTVRAPFDGYVVVEHTEVGAWLSQRDPVAEVISIDPVEINVAIPEAYISSISVGTSVSLRLEALEDKSLPAKVSRIVPQADVRARTFPVKIVVPNPGKNGTHLLKAGMLTRVALNVGKARSAVLVPKDALVLGGPSPVVYVVTTDDKQRQIAQPIPVKIGIADGSLIEVTGKLQPGQKVVVQGNERLRPGAAVRIISQ